MANNMHSKCPKVDNLGEKSVSGATKKRKLSTIWQFTISHAGLGCALLVLKVGKGSAEIVSVGETARRRK